MEKINICIVCGYDKFNHVFQSKDYNVSVEEFSISICKKCGFIFLDPRPDETEIGKYYKKENYISHTEKAESLFDKIYFKIRKYTLQKKYNMITEIKSKGNLLDIGCGVGEFLKLFKDKGWNVQGIEKDKAARDIASSKLNIKIGDFEEIYKIKDKSCEVITLWHSMEHIYKIEEMLNEIKRVITDDGLIIIALPNINSYDSKHYNHYWAAIDAPRHLYHFTKETVKELLNKNNMEVIDIKPMIFDSFYVSMLSEKNMNHSNSFIKGLFVGFLSNLKAKSNLNYSSLIYLVKKAK